MSRGDPLGWGALREMLARCAATAYGQDRARALVPAGDRAAIQAGLEDTAEARRALGAEGEPPWAGVSDIRPILAQAAPADAILDGRGLLALARTLGAVQRLAGYGTRIRSAAPTLAARWAALPACVALGERLARDFDDDGRLHDAASPRLRTLRRQIRTLRAELETHLERLLDNPAIAPALQERYVTLRNGRHVLPVREDARRRVRGIVHDRSQSGATLFIEPESSVEVNNQLTQRTLEERDEEQRILRELTAQVHRSLPDLQTLVDGLGREDLVVARAILAERLDATAPLIEEGGDLDVRAARHPLLLARAWTEGSAAPAVVPIDLQVPAERPGLLISGPNAGGKTVALETAGLLVLMAQAGCHIPAARGSRLPLSDPVLAVIGDEQSLAQDLSTFSSFVHQLREILEVAGPRTLVLLDELGAGTDPSEGAALGAALLEALLDRGARVLATTHLEPLKVFAQLEPRLRNATVAFDPERLAPTFRLEYGHPGPSYALTIAARLGLPASVIARARAHLAEGSQRLESLLADLRAREREAAARAADAGRREAEAETAVERARRVLADAEHEAAALRRQGKAEARTIVAEARRQAGQVLERLRAEATTRQQAQEAYHQLRTAEAALTPPPAAAPARALAARAGQEVELRGLGLRGRIVAEGDGMVTVEAGRLTLRVPRRDLDAAPPRPEAARPPRAPAGITVPERADVPRELHLRGFVTDDARAAVEQFLDDAVLAGHGAVRLVHGKGTGALKRAIEGCLRTHPLVGAFRPAAPAEGGGGVTVVELVEGRRGERA